MLEFLLGSATGAALIGGAAFVFRDKLAPKLVVRVPEYKTLDLPPAKRLFRVILSTDHGAEARQLWERVQPREGSDGLMEFYENDVRRDMKSGRN